jgi:hypothetical protein
MDLQWAFRSRVVKRGHMAHKAAAGLPSLTAETPTSAQAMSFFFRKIRVRVLRESLSLRIVSNVGPFWRAYRLSTRAIHPPPIWKCFHSAVFHPYEKASRDHRLHAKKKSARFT